MARAMRDPNPLGLLNFASMLLAVTDPRREHPFAEAAPDGPSREELIGMFIDVPAPETSALLALITELIDDDELLRVRIRRELATRPRLEPAWLAGLAQTETYRAVRMTHILGDGDNVMLGTRMPGGQEFTTTVYIDHNMGTLAKDGFAIPEPIESVVAGYRSVTDDPDVRWDDIALADARASVGAAIELAAITVPPFESDTWPGCRALVEWIIRGLPEGGSEHQRPQWNSEQTTELAERFFASSEGCALDDGDHRGLLDSVLWYGTDYGPCDPLRWSPVKVEILLDDWIPRKIVAPADYLALAPDLLRAFIRFSHADVGLRPQLTAEALAAVDDWEPQYQRVIQNPREQGPAAMLASLGIGGVFGQPVDYAQIALDRLARQVGGPAALARLDDAPLPHEEFQWDGIPGDVVDRVRDVLTLVDGCCAAMLGLEYRTACRRLLARISSTGPDAFRNAGNPKMSAAAVLWLIGQVNNLFGSYGGGMKVNGVMGHFGLKGSPSTRAGAMLRAAEFDSGTQDVSLASPHYLVSARRQAIISVRDPTWTTTGANSTGSRPLSCGAEPSARTERRSLGVRVGEDHCGFATDLVAWVAAGDVDQGPHVAGYEHG